MALLAVVSTAVAIDNGLGVSPPCVFFLFLFVFVLLLGLLLF